jgi:CBS domain-containing protein
MALRQGLSRFKIRAIPSAIRQYSTGAASKEALENVLGDEPDIGKQGSGWGQTQVVDILQSKVGDQGNWLWCSKDDLVLDAIKKMTKANAGSLLVFDASKLDLDSASGVTPSGDAVEGIVTERDYLTKVAVRNKASSQIKVSDIMTERSKLMTVDPHHTTMDAMTLMIKHNFRHVPVVDNGNYIGMVSMRDVVKCLIKEHHEDMGRMQEYIQGSY